MTRLTAACMVAAITFTGCGLLSDDDVGNQTLVGRIWELTGFEVSHGLMGPGTALITVRFRDDGRFEGMTTPNIYGGTYHDGPGNSLHVDNKIVSTLINEPEGSRSEQFFYFLTRATRYEVEGNELMLYCGDNRRLRLVERHDDST